MVAEYKFERTDVGQRLNWLNASCWVVKFYQGARGINVDRHSVLAAQAFIPHDQLKRAVAAL